MYIYICQLINQSQNSCFFFDKIRRRPLFLAAWRRAQMTPVFLSCYAYQQRKSWLGNPISMEVSREKLHKIIYKWWITFSPIDF